MIKIAHRIELQANNKQKTYFRKAIGCCRLAYNWGLEEWKRRYKEGERNLSGRKLRNDFNVIRGEHFPFTYEVTKYATAHAFDDLQAAYDNFFEHRADYPKQHKKKEGTGSFYIGADHAKLSDTHKGLKHLKNMAHNEGGKHQYLNVPNLGYVKMAERLRFNGNVKGVKITQDGDKFFASFQMEITEEEYLRTHPKANADKQERCVGIDLGLKEAMALSDGFIVRNPRILRKHQRKITRLSRQLSKRQHAKTKQERLQGVRRSNNYKKLSRRLSKEHSHVANIRRDFQQKLTTILTTHYAHIAIEDLNVEGMKHSRKLANSVSDVAMSETRRQIEYKSAMNGVSVTVADRWYASSKACHKCGYKKDDLTLKERTYVCPHCGTIIDRDINASLNLLSLITKQVGAGDSELITPADLAALHSRFTLNGIATSKVETGKQHKSFIRHV
ncbi:MAG: transposase [Prevotella sp.]|nr:transposase [Prevotella sp.]